MRQVVLDTETTGLEPSQGHRIIEIGCVELVNRRKTGNVFHKYINPERDVEDGAFDVHGISNETLQDKPRFAEIARELIDFIRDSELIIHNAPFDVGFLNAELTLLGKAWGQVGDYCQILDTLLLAREKHPGQKNSLDALCKRYEVDNSQRELHGALLDAQILVDVYLLLTGGQTRMTLEHASQQDTHEDQAVSLAAADRPPLKVFKPSAEDCQRHAERLAAIESASGNQCLWNRLAGGDGDP
ncbi:MAG: DNA polymerase III subunit epsilon [Thiotrichales bacterium]|nr:DNA polymerase III subunit epsilon [Thiotrichales bacterium]